MRGDPPSDLIQPDFDTLALMHLDGVLDPAQHAEFERVLRTDPKAALRLATIAEVHASLTELGQTTMAREPSRSAPSGTTRSHRRPRRSGLSLGRHRVPSWGFGVAAALVIAVILGLTQPWVAGDQVTVTEGTVLIERGGTRLRTSGTTDLRPKDILLTSANAQAHISTSAGDQLDVHGNSRLVWAHGANVQLDAGMFTAEVTPRSPNAPFLVRTPRADLTVLGTRFTVQADSAQAALAVDHGRVRLNNRDDARQIEIAANQMTVTAGAGELTAAAGALQSSTALTGLTGDYYDQQNFTAWRLRRIDPTIDFDWGPRGPAAGIAGEGFSVRWQGWLVPPVSGTYTMTFLMDDGVRLWLDGRLVLDEWHLTEKLEFSALVTLDAGRAYPLRLDFFQAPRDAVIRWYAAVDGEARQPVPSSWLRPAEWMPATK